MAAQSDDDRHRRSRHPAGARPVRRRRRRQGWRRTCSSPRSSLVFAAFSVYPICLRAPAELHRLARRGARRTGSARQLHLPADQPGLLGSRSATSRCMWLLDRAGRRSCSALAIAVLLDNARLRMRGLFRVAFIAPFVTPLVAMAQIWIVVFDQDYGAGQPRCSTCARAARRRLADHHGVGQADARAAVPVEDHRVRDHHPARRACRPSPRRLRGRLGSTARRAWRQFWSHHRAAGAPDAALPRGPADAGGVPDVRRAVRRDRGRPVQLAPRTAGLYLYNHITGSDLGTGAANSFLLVLLVLRPCRWSSSGCCGRRTR